jgi:hypothetical protein
MIPSVKLAGEQTMIWRWPWGSIRKRWMRSDMLHQSSERLLDFANKFLLVLWTLAKRMNRWNAGVRPRRGGHSDTSMFTDTKLQKKLYTVNECASCHGS